MYTCRWQEATVNLQQPSKAQTISTQMNQMNHKFKPAFQKIWNIFKLRDVVFTVAAVVDQQREYMVELFTGMSRIKLSQRLVNFPPASIVTSIITNRVNRYRKLQISKALFLCSGQITRIEKRKTKTKNEKRKLHDVWIDQVRYSID